MTEKIRSAVSGRLFAGSGSGRQERGGRNEQRHRRRRSRPMPKPAAQRTKNKPKGINRTKPPKRQPRVRGFIAQRHAGGGNLLFCPKARFAKTPLRNIAPRHSPAEHHPQNSVPEYCPTRRGGWWCMCVGGRRPSPPRKPLPGNSRADSTATPAAVARPASIRSRLDSRLRSSDRGYGTGSRHTLHLPAATLQPMWHRQMKLRLITAAGNPPKPPIRAMSKINKP